MLPHGARHGLSFALLSALLFGASTPLAKLLLQDGVAPQLLAGLFYLGSGLGLGLVLLGRRLAGVAAPEARLRATDLPALVPALLLGGVAGPVLMMAGLARTSAGAASLLQNLEGIATMGIAWLVYRENVDRRLLVGALAILAGAVLLSWSGTSGAGRVGSGGLLIAAACLAWGADNNLTRQFAAADPVQVAATKGLVAGLVNVTLGVLTGGNPLPASSLVLLAGLVGFLGYGVSLVLFVLGLRHLGAARTAAYYSTAPFIGAVLSILLLAEPPTALLLAAGALMLAGVYLHLRESHAHEHRHERLDHEHRHVHDAHHQHVHAAADPPGEPHSHWHRHEPRVHSHAHYPDLHHRHGHS